MNKSKKILLVSTKKFWCRKSQNWPQIGSTAQKWPQIGSTAKKWPQIGTTAQKWLYCQDFLDGVVVTAGGGAEEPDKDEESRLLQYVR